MDEKYTISVFTEDRVGLLNRITILFTRRHVNIESITASESEIDGIYRYTIVVKAEREQVSKLTAQIEKQVEVLKAFYHREPDVISRELALYKVSSEVLTENDLFTRIIQEHHATILSVAPDYVVVEKAGDERQIRQLLHELERFGVLEFVRSGRVAITKPMKTLTAYLKDIETNSHTHIQHFNTQDYGNN